MTKSEPLRCSLIANIIIEDSRWDKSDESYCQLCEDTFAEILKEIDFGWNGGLEFSLKLTDDDELRELNSSFRGKDEATNVLSFPSQVIHKANLEEYADTNQIYLGDMAISYEKVAEESNKYGITFDNHLTHLILHGTLHLLGFDHIDDKDAFEMESLEKKILKSMNIDNPYDLMVMDVK